MISLIFFMGYHHCLRWQEMISCLEIGNHAEYCKYVFSLVSSADKVAMATKKSHINKYVYIYILILYIHTCIHTYEYRTYLNLLLQPFEQINEKSCYLKWCFQKSGLRGQYLGCLQSYAVNHEIFTTNNWFFCRFSLRPWPIAFLVLVFKRFFLCAPKPGKHRNVAACKTCHA